MAGLILGPPPQLVKFHPYHVSMVAVCRILHLLSEQPEIKQTGSNPQAPSHRVTHLQHDPMINQHDVQKLLAF